MSEREWLADALNTIIETITVDMDADHSHFVEDDVEVLQRAAALLSGEREPDAVDLIVRKRRGCGICGGRLVTIRPRYNDVGGQDREVCPTCLADRMDQIRTIADPQTYQPMQAED